MLPSGVKRQLYVLAVLVNLTVAVTQVFRHGLDPNVVTLLIYTTGATAAAYGVGRWAEASEKKNGQATLAGSEGGGPAVP